MHATSEYKYPIHGHRMTHHLLHTSSRPLAGKYSVTLTLTSSPPLDTMTSLPNHISRVNMAPKPRDGFPDFNGKTVCNGRIRLVEELGEGAYGVVYRGVDASSTKSESGEPRQFAVKILEKADPRSHRWIFQQREVAAHQSVSDHPNIVKLYEVHECQHFVYIMLEYCPGRDLYYALVDRHLYYHKDELVKSVFLQILDALEYCHEHDVFHRDLKPDNVLTNEDGTKVKLADFGLCTTSPVSDTFRCGSAGYMSPGKSAVPILV